MIRLPRRLLAVLLVAAIGLLALAFSGLFSWISSVLFLILELTAESLRPLIGRQRQVRRHPSSHPRSRSPSGEIVHRSSHPRRRGRPKSLPSRLREEVAEPEPEPQPPPPHHHTPTSRVLVPLGGDQPGLLAFALEECRKRQAELLLLFLRPLAVTPMGPIPLRTLAEDEQARTLFERAGVQAREAGVPLRTLYQATHDVPASILDTARTAAADVVVMEATRRNLLVRTLKGDEIQAILTHLPKQISLVLHNPS